MLLSGIFIVLKVCHLNFKLFKTFFSFKARFTLSFLLLWNCAKYNCAFWTITLGLWAVLVELGNHCVWYPAAWSMSGSWVAEQQIGQEKGGAGLICVHLDLTYEMPAKKIGHHWLSKYQREATTKFSLWPTSFQPTGPCMQASWKTNVMIDWITSEVKISDISYWSGLINLLSQ